LCEFSSRAIHIVYFACNSHKIKATSKKITCKELVDLPFSIFLAYSICMKACLHGVVIIKQTRSDINSEYDQ
jgi:hypothetical protein